MNVKHFLRRLTRQLLPARCPECGGRPASMSRGGFYYCPELTCPNLFIGTLPAWNKNAAEVAGKGKKK